MIGEDPILIVHKEEPSEYEGSPVIESKCPYDFRPHPRKPDPELPRLKRMQEKVKCLALDTKDYAADIVFNRQP